MKKRKGPAERGFGGPSDGQVSLGASLERKVKADYYQRISHYKFVKAASQEGAASHFEEARGRLFAQRAMSVGAGRT